MAMMIREYIDGNGFYSQVGDYKEQFSLEEADSSSRVDPNSLMVDIESIHAAPYVTRNFTRYMSKCLKESVPTWTQPYLRPLIKHHNEASGDIIGRVCSTKYETKNTLSGTPALLFTVNVPNEQAKKDIQNGLLDTVSIGVIANDVRCSVCGKQLAGGDMCEHERGVTYTIDGVEKQCTWDIYSMEAKEVSYVVVPSDMYTKTIKVYPAVSTAKAGSAITESLNKKTIKGDGTMAKENDSATELKEAAAKISELTAKVAELEQAKTEADTKISELTEGKKASDDKLTALIEEKTAVETKLTESTSLREQLEKEIADTKSELKKSMVENLQTYRKMAGKKTLDESVVQERSYESINDSIMDIKEELSLVKKSDEKDPKEKLESLEKIEDPTLKDEEKMDIKENHEEQKVDLQKGLENIFGSVMSAYK